MTMFQLLVFGQRLVTCMYIPRGKTIVWLYCGNFESKFIYWKWVDELFLVFIELKHVISYLHMDRACLLFNY